MNMLINDKKKAASLIVSRMRTSPDGESYEEEREENPELDSSMGLTAAAERLMSAVKAEDSGRVVEAIRNMFHLLEMEEEQGEE